MRQRYVMDGWVKWVGLGWITFINEGNQTHFLFDFDTSHNITSQIFVYYTSYMYLSANRKLPFENSSYTYIWVKHLCTIKFSANLIASNFEKRAYSASVIPIVVKIIDGLISRLGYFLVIIGWVIHAV